MNDAIKNFTERLLKEGFKHENNFSLFEERFNKSDGILMTKYVNTDKNYVDELGIYFNTEGYLRVMLSFECSIQCCQWATEEGEIKDYEKLVVEVLK